MPFATVAGINSSMEKTLKNRALFKAKDNMAFLSLGQMLKLIIRGYRYFLSPWFGKCCRFYPSCSEYAETSIERFGVIRGTILTIGRLLKCHPWHVGGVDEVPSLKEEKWF